jgi:hypothetical protein
MLAARRATTRRRARDRARHLASTQSPPDPDSPRPRPRPPSPPAVAIAPKPATSSPPTTDGQPSTDGRPPTTQTSTAAHPPTDGQTSADGQPSAAAHPPTDGQPAAAEPGSAAHPPTDGQPPAPEPPAAAAGHPVPESGTRAPSGVGAPRHLADRSGRGRALVGVLVAVGFAGVLGIGAMLVAEARSEGTDATTGTTAPSRTTTSQEVTTTTTVVVASPAEAFTEAAGRLEAAGTFAYHGTVSASDVSAVRPSLWLAVDITVEGEASLADGRIHEVAVAESGQATETVVAGVDVFGRSAGTRDSLGDESYEGIPELSTPEPATKGAAGLVRWLAGVAEPSAAGVDDQGRRVYRGIIPATVLGPTERGRRAVDAEVLLTLDRAGDPVHVDITTVPEGPPLHLAFDLSGLGAPVTIEPPAEAEG